MNLKTIKKENLEKINLILNTFLNSRKFPPSLPEKDIELILKKDLSIFSMAQNNSGNPSNTAIGILQFNWKPILELMDQEGIIELDKSNLFLDWKIKTNILSIQEYSKKTTQYLVKPIKFHLDDLFESIIRDLLNNNTNKNIPIYKTGQSFLPTLCFKKEIINGIECDIVGRNNKGEIKVFIEICKGPITSDDIKKMKERHELEPTAKIWFMGSRINDTVYNIITEKKGRITLISQLIDKYPIIRRVL